MTVEIFGGFIIWRIPSLSSNVLKDWIWIERALDNNKNGCYWMVLT